MQKIPAVVDKITFYGILLAILLISIGGVFYFIAAGQTQAVLPDYPPALSFKVSMVDIISAALRLSPMGFIQLGLLFLVLMQIVRLALLACFLIKAKDYLFLGMSLFILGVLTYGLF